jgi:threonine/homoserine/homoserine lactone efflux protein
MTSVLPDLIPLILAAALVPIEITVVLLLLASPRGTGKAAAFVLGATLVRLLKGLVFGYVFASSPDADGDSSGTSPVAATLQLVLGILLLVGAYRSLTKTPDPDEQPPQWMASIDQATPLKALGFGAAAALINPKLWVFTLTALGVVSAAELEQGVSAAAYLVYVIFGQILLILPILAMAVAPQPAAKTLGRATDWLVRNTSSVTLVLKLVFGAYFSWKGVNGLLN